MYTPIKIEEAEGSLPFWFYENLTLNAIKTYLSFSMMSGYSYYLNHIIMQWPERDNVGALFNNSLTVQMIDNTGNHDMQVQPVPPRLLTTPGSAGITTDAGGNMLAGPGPSSMTIINRLFYETSVLQLYVDRNSAVVWPLNVDVLLVGYTIKNRA